MKGLGYVKGLQWRKNNGEGKQCLRPSLAPNESDQFPVNLGAQRCLVLYCFTDQKPNPLSTSPLSALIAAQTKYLGQRNMKLWRRRWRENVSLKFSCFTRTSVIFFLSLFCLSRACTSHYPYLYSASNNIHTFKKIKNMMPRRRVRKWSKNKVFLSLS